jgi:hypothetical protein
MQRRMYLLICLALLSASSTNAAESKEVKIKRALSSAPANVAAGAKVVDIDQKGNMTLLREGSNGFTCIPGHLRVVGDDPLCMDGEALQWVLDLIAHKPKPTNTQPGILYLLAGGTDWSATDPWATSGKVQHWAPCWLIVWPFDPKSTGLSDIPKNSGTWIMWAGTPYAHLMINQKP